MRWLNLLKICMNVITNDCVCNFCCENVFLQVSKSWKNLAEDNWLWYRVYKQISEKMSLVSMPEHTNWKEFMKEEFEKRNTLLTNWKVRLKLFYLKFIYKVHSINKVNFFEKKESKIYLFFFFRIFSINVNSALFRIVLLQELFQYCKKYLF